MNQKLKDKLTYTTLGYCFVALNYYALTQNRAIFGLGFGFTAFYFFIKSLRIKP